MFTFIYVYIHFNVVSVIYSRTLMFGAVIQCSTGPDNASSDGASVLGLQSQWG